MPAERKMENAPRVQIKNARDGETDNARRNAKRRTLAEREMENAPREQVKNARNGETDNSRRTRRVGLSPSAKWRMILKCK
ncbi:transmembrane protein 79 [Corchorus olitorius]|uniref:Transmembrane protein 79 n=1 Tax=Corchorus olitorius TaxID=93759 RepID=A0A1R3I529_9ROSI|nr:transmembrane protein 79 [Corchorus olitorius]